MKFRILFVLAVLSFSVVNAKAGEKTKLIGEQLSKRIQGYEVLAGISKEPGIGFNFMVVAYQNGTRELYWNDGVKSGIDTGNHRFIGDQTCVIWKTSFEGKERCYDVYQTDNNQYESWHNGEIAFSYYKIR